MEGKSYGSAQWSQRAVGGEDRVSPPCAASFRRHHERIIRGTPYGSGCNLLVLAPETAANAHFFLVFSQLLPFNSIFSLFSLLASLTATF